MTSRRSFFKACGLAVASVAIGLKMQAPLPALALSRLRQDADTWMEHWKVVPKPDALPGMWWPVYGPDGEVSIMHSKSGRP